MGFGPRGIGALALALNRSSEESGWACVEGSEKRGWLEHCEHQAHLWLKTIPWRKHKSIYSLSPKQLQSLVLHVLIIIFFPLPLPPSPGCLMDMGRDKWGQKTPVTAHNVLLCGSPTQKVSTTNTPLQELSLRSWGRWGGVSYWVSCPAQSRARRLLIGEGTFGVGQERGGGGAGNSAEHLLWAYWKII